MADEVPDFICPSCLWQGDEPFYCGHCGAAICPKCQEELTTPEAYRQAEANNINDANKEDRRAGL